jgi:molybdenum cofactor biosynthesis MoaF-like protein
MGIGTPTPPYEPRQCPKVPTRKPGLEVQSTVVRLVAGDNAGFSDTVEYEAVVIRDGLALLSWREHIGSTIVHVLDFISGEAYTFVTPEKGGFMRLKGRLEIKGAA